MEDGRPATDSARAERDERTPMLRLRLRCWLSVLDVAECIGVPQVVYLWLVARTAAAIDWGPPRAIPPDEDEPF